MDNIQDIYADLEKDLPLAEAKIRTWSKNYFEGNKNRYLSDLAFVKKFYTGGKILEIGSAPFHFTYLMKRSGLAVTAIDLAPQRFEKFIQKHQLEVLACNIEQEPLPFEEETFDLIVFFEVFEHLRINPINTLKEISRVLKSGGTLLLQTPNLYNAMRIKGMIRGQGFDDPYKEFSKLERFGHMGHTRVYTVNQVKEFLQKTGTTPKQVFYTSKKNERLKKYYATNFLAKLFPKIRTHFLIVADKK